MDIYDKFKNGEKITYAELLRRIPRDFRYNDTLLVIGEYSELDFEVQVVDSVTIAIWLYDKIPNYDTGVMVKFSIFGIESLDLVLFNTPEFELEDS